MKNMQRTVLGLSLLGLLTLTSCNNNGSVSSVTSAGGAYTQDGQPAYNALSGEARKDTYTYYESYMPSSFNSIKTMQSEDARYIANMVDGLVDVDRANNLVPCLATSWDFNDDYDEVSFQIRSNVPWVYNRNNGRDEFKVGGVTQYVKAQDWVYAAKENLTAANGSDSYYLYTMFVEGAAEFFYYTYLRYENSVEEDPNKRLTEEQIAATLRAVTGDQSITPSIFQDIANFSRVGITASEDGRTLTYKLTSPAPYFISALTYTPFLPVCEAFVNTFTGGVGAFGTGARPDSILVNGAYVIETFEPGVGSQISFTQNESYWDIDHVMTKRIQALHYPDNAGYSASRIAYESGTIDGFTVSSLDSEGWQKYVTGAGNTGTIDNPVSADARVAEGLGNGSTYAFVLNTNRGASATAMARSIIPTVAGWDATDSNGNNIQVLNTNKALSVSPALRELVLKSLDLETYTLGLGSTEYDRTKYLVNTWTPANFIKYDAYTAADNADGIFGNDYVDFVKKAFMDEFYAGDYSATSRAAADAALGYSQLSTGVNSAGVYSNGLDDQSLDAPNQARLNQLKADAQAEISAWNTAHPGDRIITPVIIEYPGLVYDDTAYQEHAAFINASNARVNGCWYGGDNLSASVGRLPGATICTTTQERDAIFRIVTPTKNEISTNNIYQEVSYYSWSSLLNSGWGPDYSDPLTFANTLVTDGDLSGNTGASRSNPYAAELQKSYADYDRLVSEAAALTDSKERYTKFAEAEIELLYNVNIIRPLYMAGLGKAVVVSKTIPFRTTSAPYGISGYKYKSIEVLNRPINNTEYQALRAEREVQNSK